MGQGKRRVASHRPDPEQRTRFAAAARALGADESEDAFRAKLSVIARQKPAPEPPKVGKPRKKLDQP